MAAAADRRIGVAERTAPKPIKDNARGAPLRLAISDKKTRVAAVSRRKACTFPSLARLSQLDPDLGNFADGLNGNWLIGLVRSRKNSGKAAAVPTK
jgi:hypothetical protein